MIDNEDGVDIRDHKLASDDRKQNEKSNKKHHNHRFLFHHDDEVIRRIVCAVIKKEFTDGFSELISYEYEKNSEALKTDFNRELKEIICEDEVDCKVIKIDLDSEAKKKKVLELDTKYREEKRSLLALKNQAPLLTEIQILIRIQTYLKSLISRGLCPYDENLETIRRILRKWNQEKTYDNLMALTSTRPAFDIPEGYEHLNEIFKLFEEDYHCHAESAMHYARSFVGSKTCPTTRIKYFLQANFQKCFVKKNQVNMTSAAQEKGGRFCCGE